MATFRSILKMLIWLVLVLVCGTRGLRSVIRAQKSSGEDLSQNAATQDPVDFDVVVADGGEHAEGLPGVEGTSDFAIITTGTYRVTLSVDYTATSESATVVTLLSKLGIDLLSDSQTLAQGESISVDLAGVFSLQLGNILSTRVRNPSEDDSQQFTVQYAAFTLEIEDACIMEVESLETFEMEFIPVVESPRVIPLSTVRVAEGLCTSSTWNEVQLR